MTTCTSTCRHRTATCALPAGHPGEHEARGERAAGYVPVTICTWENPS